MLTSSLVKVISENNARIRELTKQMRKEVTARRYFNAGINTSDVPFKCSFIISQKDFKYLGLFVQTYSDAYRRDTNYVHKENMETSSP